MAYIEFLEQKMAELRHKADAAGIRAEEYRRKAEEEYVSRSKIVAEHNVARKWFTEATGKEATEIADAKMLTVQVNGATSVRKRAETFVRKLNGKEFSPKELGVAIKAEDPDASDSNIWNTIVRMRDSGMIESTGTKGVYRPTAALLEGAITLSEDTSPESE